MIGSDRWVGSAVVTLFDLASSGASVISVVSDVAFSCMYYYNVHWRLATSSYSCIIDATSFVWFAVCGGISILSKQLALYLALSILLFYAAKISSRSTGVGVACCNRVSAFVLFSPCNFRILDMCGNFFALVAEPRIKTNFYSSSVAIYYSFASRVYRSTLVECVPLCLALSRILNRASYSWNIFYHLSSIAVTVSGLTIG
jgi:hypothetical protein